ncbi:energy transducer TonB [Dyella nitratireducens]|uniref:Energy transducer TonB n=1 Tax=Dyella nitratireducens TaxID=1849580 RepID=A0ABQ1G991_9GAMM|nr:energy transducer TonB [Dyella nitratireducens]GGA39235.1 hypothetical protein GCM10010981_30630 [Dyella nitratireducens]GLQ40420.1 hypothetical protein GCM10007902_02690 [Dyella nitratireducens]
MKRWVAGGLLALSAWTASAGPSGAHKAVEASMLVTGWIEVAPDGSVHGYTIDQPEKLPQTVINLIKKDVPAWKFRFDEPAAAIQRTPMHMRIKATPVDDKHDVIAISDASFGDLSGNDTDSISSKARQPIKYPREAVEAGVAGTVYMIIRVNRQGKVEDIAAEQVDLHVRIREAQMRYFRDMLAKAAIESAKNWTFNLPTTGKHAADPYWNVAVPVSFNFGPPHMSDDADYGKWDIYVPGPRQPVPWMTADAQNAISPNTIPAGSISQAESSLHLTTPLGGA